MTTADDERVMLPDETGTSVVRLRVNGRDREVQVTSTQTLLDALRQNLKLYGARNGCGVGMCGACTVLREGEAANSCLSLASLSSDVAITTVEGLEGPDGTLSRVQDVFLRYRAFQCAYCTSGFILALEALIRRVSQPSEDDIIEAFSGHVCRCGSYSRIMAAARELIGVGGDSA